MASSAAREAYNARLRAELKADPRHPAHGTTNGYRAGCRCIGAGSCTAANSADQQARRATRSP